MRFPTGVTDQYIYFVAVDSTDYSTRETGLSSFTVYRARNGAAAVAYTSPTIAEVSAANMPGVYSLLLDEDMTIGSGNKSEQVVLHITQASMAPVTLVFELYRPDVTEGETLSVASGGLNAALGTGVITAGSIAADAIGASELASDAVSEIATGVWAASTRLLTAGTNIVLAKGTGITGLNDLDASGIRGAVGMASANLDTQIGLLATAANLATVAGYIDTEIAAILADTNAIKGKTDSLTFTVSGVVDANVAYVNEVQVNGDGAGTPWGP